MLRQLAAAFSPIQHQWALLRLGSPAAINVCLNISCHCHPLCCKTWSWCSSDRRTQRCSTIAAPAQQLLGRCPTITAPSSAVAGQVHSNRRTQLGNCWAGAQQSLRPAQQSFVSQSVLLSFFGFIHNCYKHLHMQPTVHGEMRRACRPSAAGAAAGNNSVLAPLATRHSSHTGCQCCTMACMVCPLRTAAAPPPPRCRRAITRRSSCTPCRRAATPPAAPHWGAALDPSGCRSQRCGAPAAVLRVAW